MLWQSLDDYVPRERQGIYRTTMNKCNSCNNYYCLCVFVNFPTPVCAGIAIGRGYSPLVDAIPLCHHFQFHVPPCKKNLVYQLKTIVGVVINHIHIHATLLVGIQNVSLRW